MPDPDFMMPTENYEIGVQLYILANQTRRLAYKEIEDSLYSDEIMDEESRRIEADHNRQQIQYPLVLACFGNVLFHGNSDMQQADPESLLETFGGCEESPKKTRAKLQEKEQQLRLIYDRQFLQSRKDYNIALLSLGSGCLISAASIWTGLSHIIPDAGLYDKSFMTFMGSIAGAGGAAYGAMSLLKCLHKPSAETIVLMKRTKQEIAELKTQAQDYDNAELALEAFKYNDPQLFSADEKVLEQGERILLNVIEKRRETGLDQG